MRSCGDLGDAADPSSSLHEPGTTAGGGLIEKAKAASRRGKREALKLFHKGP